MKTREQSRQVVKKFNPGLGTEHLPQAFSVSLPKTETVTAAKLGKESIYLRRNKNVLFMYLSSAGQRHCSELRLQKIWD